MIIKSEAIVLKTIDFRETSKIAIFFSKDYGKVKGVLKGVRKDPKKFGSNVDKFTVNDIVYYEYRNSDIHLVSHCDLKSYFFPIRQDYKRNLAANYMTELVDIIMPVEQENKEIYKLMMDFLSSLETTEDIDKLVHMFQVKILLLSGFRPLVDECVQCGKRIRGKARFSEKSGGLICVACPTQETNFSIISEGTVQSILHVEKNDWPTALRLALTAPIKKELKFILNNFLVYHLERRVKSAKFI